jgi:hypothetical protein
MGAVRATKAQIDLELRRLDRMHDIISRLLIADHLPLPQVAERVGVKVSRLKAWLDLNSAE